VRRGCELGGGVYCKCASIRREFGGRVFAKVALLSPQPLDLDAAAVIEVSIGKQLQRTEKTQKTGPKRRENN
jgi:hypothetical protein